MFRFGSKRDINAEHKCTIRLLDDPEVLECEFQHLCKGEYILDYVCKALNVLEKDYFGLRYVDSHNQRHWLDLSKSVMKQVKGLDSIIFCFRVKYYPPDPAKLKEDVTRYQLFLQLKRDLLHGRLHCTQADSVQLCAYILQSFVGDFDPLQHNEGYVSEMKLLPKHTAKLDAEIATYHEQLSGTLAEEAERAFLNKACTFDTYGVDPHPVKDHKGVQLYVGVNHIGIVGFSGGKKTHEYRWEDIVRINVEGKMLIVHVLILGPPGGKQKHMVGFKCPTHAACMHLWRCIADHQCFFTSVSSNDAVIVAGGGGLFSRSRSFRYSGGRVQRELLDDATPLRQDGEQPQVVRRAFTLQRNNRRTLDGDIGQGLLSVSEHPLSGAGGGGDASPNAVSTSRVLHSDDDDDDATAVPSSSVPPPPLPKIDTTPTKQRRRQPPSPPNGQISSSSSAPAHHHQQQQQQQQQQHSRTPNNSNTLTSVHRNKSGSRIARYMAVFLTSSLCVLFALSLLLLVAMETDHASLATLREHPFVATLRFDYYMPAKRSFMAAIERAAAALDFSAKASRTQ